MAKAGKNPDPPTAREGYTVLARRYRPENFQDLIGQEHIAQALVNAIEHNRVAHAYIFTGHRGVGKTSTARILAKALNCDHGPTTKPCGKCSNCVAIALGEDIDVLEIDGASNNKVEEARDLRNNVQYKPTRGRFKIYIIDEVHMLTPQAFNALLKTLEEPPPHVKFIFATTEIGRIPVTILSRCQRFDFAGIGVQQIASHLAEIARLEKREVEPEAIDLIARRASGSMRDGQSLFDQALAFSTGVLTKDLVHKLVGTVDEERVFDMAEAVLKGHTLKILEILEDATRRGLLMGELVDQLIGFWRDLMITSVSSTVPADAGVPSSHLGRFQELAKSASLDTILAGLDILALAKTRLKGTHHPRAMVELCLMRLSRLGDLIPLGQILEQLQSGGVRAQTAPPGRETLPPEGLKKKYLSESPGNNGPEPEVSAVALSADTLPGIWTQVLANIGPMLGAEVKKCGLPAISGPNSLVLCFPRAYNHALELCQDPNRLSRIQESLNRISGQAWVLRVQSVPDPIGMEAAKAEPAPEPARPKENPKDAAEKDPLVRKALEVFGGQIVRADAGFGVYPPANEDGQQIEDDN